MKKSTVKFTLAMIVKNEARNLPRSLAPVCRCFDEVVVIDTGSTDETVKLAGSYGARVESIKWPNDFAAARNVSIAASTGDWILWYDADNYISPEQASELRKLVTRDRDGSTIFWCTEVVVPEGERLLQKRVFPRRKDVYFTGRVHEQLVHPPDFRAVAAPVEILHWGYLDKAAAREKGRRNLELLLEMACRQGHDFYICYQLGRTLLNLRRFNQARIWLDLALEDDRGRLVNPGLYSHAGLLKARALSRLGRPEKAEAVLTGLTERDPSFGPAHYELGRMSYSAGFWLRAANGFKNFLKLGIKDGLAGYNPDLMRFTALMLQGRSLLKLGQNEEAGSVFKLAFQADPQNPEPGLALADLALSRGRTREARHHLDLCLKISPHNRRAVNLLRELESNG